jgi:Tfp pilus assembly protein PilP
VNLINLLNETVSPAEHNVGYGFDRHLLSRFCFKRLSWAILPMLLSVPSIGQNTNQAAKYTAGEIEKPVEIPTNYAAIRYNSSSRRDPFLNPLLLQKKSKQEDEEIARGLPPPGIAGTFIAQVTLQGTSFCDERRVAIVRGADNRAYFLKEGDRLFDGYLKNVETDSITLVRETKLRSGKTLTQDVTKRLRTP